ncbi:MAG: hypothetical protein ABJM29_03910 [Rhizobiaceae bacterium]
MSYNSDHRTSSITSQRSDGTYVTTTTHSIGARSTSYSDGSGGSGSGKSIALDLDGGGLEITELGRSTMFVDAAGDGLFHHSAWAGFNVWSVRRRSWRSQGLADYIARKAR